MVCGLGVGEPCFIPCSCHSSFFFFFLSLIHTNSFLYFQQNTYTDFLSAWIFFFQLFTENFCDYPTNMQSLSTPWWPSIPFPHTVFSTAPVIIYLLCSHFLFPLPQLRDKLPCLSHSTWLAMCLENRLVVGTQLKMHQMSEWMSTKSVTQPRCSLPCSCVCAAVYTKETVKLGLSALFHGFASVIPLWGLGTEAFCLRIKGLFAFTAWNKHCHS